MRRSISAILLSTAVLMTYTGSFCLAAQATPAQLRAQQRQKSVIRRLYGPENAHIRKARRELEERPERSRTGRLGDPNHKVPYENHPYDPETKRRKLEEENTGLGVETVKIEGNFRPMRIRFDTKALDSRRTTENAAKIDFIENEILPKTREFWSAALAVIPVSGNLKISTNELDGRSFCGDSEFTEVPAEHISAGMPNTDLVLYVSGTPSTRFCSGTTLAVAVACNFDQFDRPTAGAINVCLDQIEVDADGTASFFRLEPCIAVADWVVVLVVASKLLLIWLLSEEAAAACFCRTTCLAWYPFPTS